METHGIPITIEWGKFQIGTSMFIPGVDQKKLQRDFRREMQRLKLKVVIKPVVEQGMLGIRIWRVP
jgi:hypothetical protein